MQTKFSFKGLDFEYIKQEHLPKIIEMLKKESVCEHVFYGPNTEADTTMYFQPAINAIDEAIKNNETLPQHVFAITNGNDFLGECALLPIDYAEGNFLIGYQLDDIFWKQGYGTIACEFLIDYGFNKLGASRLSGDCMSGNLGSKAIMEKCGFRQEGHQRKYWKKNGRFYDNLLFGLLKEDLEKEK